MIFHKHSHVGAIGNRNIQILEHSQTQLPVWHIIDATYLFRLKPVYWLEPCQAPVVWYGTLLR